MSLRSLVVRDEVLDGPQTTAFGAPIAPSHHDSRFARSERCVDAKRCEERCKFGSYWFVIGLTLLVLPSATLGQCTFDWLPQPQGAALNGDVWALTVYNGELIAGGAFTHAGDVPVNYIARWDGQAWQSLNDGLSGQVFKLVMLNGALVAAGTSTSTGLFVVRWDGTGWQSLPNPPVSYSSGLASLTVYNNELVAGWNETWNPWEDPFGYGVIHRLSGADWEPMQEGLWGTVGAMTVLDGVLYAGGGSPRINGGGEPWVSRWTGSRWEFVAHVAGEGHVNALGAFENQLTAAGNFIDDIAARWNGTNWQLLGAGRGLGIALTEYDGELVVGGDLAAEYPASENISRWNGSEWLPLGTGLSGGPWPSASALHVFNGQLFAGGSFLTAGGHDSPYFARWGPVCPGDFNGDCIVGLSDLAILLAHSGTGNGSTYADGDLDSDGDVDLSDLTIMLSNFGRACP